MRLADAFEIVLDLARQNIRELLDDEVQQAAIAKVEEFVRTYDFDDAPVAAFTRDFDGYEHDD